MILEVIITIFYGIVLLLITLLPSNVVEKVTMVQPPEMISWAACFFPMDALFLAIGMFLTWYGILMTWAIIEWVYKKIPGVN